MPEVLPARIHAVTPAASSLPGPAPCLSEIVEWLIHGGVSGVVAPAPLRQVQTARHGAHPAGCHHGLPRKETSFVNIG